MNPQDHAALARIFSTRPYVQAAVVYGSFARGELRKDSDLDLAVLAKKALTPRQHVELIGAAALAFGRPVDLIDLRTVRGPVLREALSTGTVVYRRSPMALGGVIRDMLVYEADEAPIFNRAVERALERCLRTSCF